MLKFVNLKKITSAGLLSSLFAGSLITQPVLTRNAVANSNSEIILAQANTSSDLVDVELVLAVDVSSSVDDAEFLLQRNGYVQAFESVAVKDAINKLPNGLAVTVMFWASNRDEGDRKSVHSIGWYKLVKNGNNIDGLQNFINRVGGVQRTGVGTNNHKVDNQKMQNGTDLASAIKQSQNLIDNNNYRGLAKVIDISGDGLSDDTPITQTDIDYVRNYIANNNLRIGNYLTNKNNSSNKNSCDRGHYGDKRVQDEVDIRYVFCPPVLRARNAAVDAGITINGLPIVDASPNDNAQRNREDEVDEYYRYNVIGGAGAFVETATFNTFSEAVTRKISREIVNAANKPIAQPDSITTDEDTTATYNLITGDPNNNNAGRDTDPKGSNLTVTKFVVGTTEYTPGTRVTMPSGALLTVNSNGDVTYNPNGQFESMNVGDSLTTPDEFTYTVINTTNYLSSAKATLNINGAADSPVAEDDSRTTDEDSVKWIPVLMNDSDPNTARENLTITKIDNTAINLNSPVKLSSGATLELFEITDSSEHSVLGKYILKYDPTPSTSLNLLNEGQTATETFTYTVSDPEDNTDQGNATITVTGITDTFAD